MPAPRQPKRGRQGQVAADAADREAFVAALREAARHLHLEQAVLRVQEAEREVRVEQVGRVDGGDAVGVALHADLAGTVRDRGAEQRRDLREGKGQDQRREGEGRLESWTELLSPG